MTTDTQKNYRSGLIKLVHVARRELNLDEPSYRAILKAQGGLDSLSKMNTAQMSRVLEYFKAQGFRVRKAPNDRKQATGKDASKVRALWLMLHELGAVRDPSEAALTAYVKRMAGVDDVQWMRGERRVSYGDVRAYKARPEVVIESLKKWAMRVLPEAVYALKAEVLTLHRNNQLSPERLEYAAHAFKRSDAGEGFDVLHEVWDNLRIAAGHQQPH